MHQKTHLQACFLLLLGHEVAAGILLQSTRRLRICRLIYPRVPRPIEHPWVPGHRQCTLRPTGPSFLLPVRPWVEVRKACNGFGQASSLHDPWFPVSVNFLSTTAKGSLARFPKLQGSKAAPLSHSLSESKPNLYHRQFQGYQRSQQWLERELSLQNVLQ